MDLWYKLRILLSWDVSQDEQWFSTGSEFVLAMSRDIFDCQNGKEVLLVSHV